MNMKAQYQYFPDAQMPEAPPPTYEESFPMFPDKVYATGSHQQHTHQQHTHQQHNLSTTSTTTGIRSNAGAQQQMKNSSMTVFIFLS